MSWHCFQSRLLHTEADCFGRVGHGYPQLQDSVGDMLVLAKGSWASVEHAHPNKDVD